MQNDSGRQIQPVVKVRLANLKVQIYILFSIYIVCIIRKMWKLTCLSVLLSAGKSALSHIMVSCLQGESVCRETTEVGKTACEQTV